MRSQSKAVCWRTASWTFVGLVLVGLVVTAMAGA